MMRIFSVPSINSRMRSMDCLDFTYYLVAHAWIYGNSSQSSDSPGESSGHRRNVANSDPINCKSSLQRRGVAYEMDAGGGAFYGPKIDFKVRDAIGRWWQCSTSQVDFTLPERFQLEYIGPDGQAHRPIMLHRAITGSIGTLLWSFDRALRRRLSSVAWLRYRLPCSRLQNGIMNMLGNWSRLCVRNRSGYISDTRKEKTGAKIRDAQLQKIPYMVILGDKEIENQNVSVRHRTKGDLGARPLQEFRDGDADLDCNPCGGY